MAKIIKHREEEPAPPPPPVQEELPLIGLRRGDQSRGVATLQLRLGAPVTGVFDEVTEYTVKTVQRDLRFMPTGIATPELHGRLGLPWPPLEN